MITKFKLFESDEVILAKCIDTGRMKNIKIGDLFQVAWHHDIGWYLTDINKGEQKHYEVEPLPYRDGGNSKIWGAIFSTVDDSMEDYKKRLREEQFDL